MQLSQFLIIAARLTGWPQHDFPLAGIDDAVIMGMRGGEISHMFRNAQDFVPVGQHRIARQPDDGMRKNLFGSLKQAYGNAGQIPDHGAKIGEIKIFYCIICNSIQLYCIYYDDAIKNRLGMLQ